LFINLNDDKYLNNLVELMSNKDIILLGESTHGTQEFYEIRSEISKKLIEEHGFNFIVVEGDWDSIYKLNLYVKGLSDKETAYYVLKTFNRWPEWMWANEEIRLLAEWLKKYNLDKPLENKVGIYGMDVYGVENSILRVQEILGDVYDCLSFFITDFSDYTNYLVQGYNSCNEEAERIYNLILSDENIKNNLSNKDYFYLKQNAFVVKNAELHYRAMVAPWLSSWNERVLHMNSTVEKLMNQNNSKGILWAHNTHVGDARATQMFDSNSINIGQLLREANINLFIVGFGIYEGNVIAGRSWGSEMEIMRIPKANMNSYEYILNQMNQNDFLIILDDVNLPDEIVSINNNRAIGVVYNPEVEFPGNYVMTDLKERYDAFIFIKETNELVLLN
jgi:erythromycin esterase